MLCLAPEASAAWTVPFETRHMNVASDCAVACSVLGFRRMWKCFLKAWALVLQRLA